MAAPLGACGPWALLAPVASCCCSWVFAGLLLLWPPLDFGSQPLLSPLLLQLLLPLFLLLLPLFLLLQLLFLLLLLLFLPLQELCIGALVRVPQHSRCLSCKG